MAAQEQLKAKYQQAARLANEGKYSAALKLAESEAHPKFKELAAKIRAKMDDDFDLMDEPPAPAVTVKTSKRKTPGYRKFTLPLLIILGTFLLIVIVSGVIQYRQSERRVGIHVAVYGVCLKVYDVEQWDYCKTGADDAIEIYGDEIEYCYDQSKEADLEQQFLDCLVDNGVKI